VAVAVALVTMLVLAAVVQVALDHIYQHPEVMEQIQILPMVAGTVVLVVQDKLIYTADRGLDIPITDLMRKTEQVAEVTLVDRAGKIEQQLQLTLVLRLALALLVVVVMMAVVEPLVQAV
jgi:Tfp pilus assembly pilus retraction ATPase PilT